MDSLRGGSATTGKHRAVLVGREVSIFTSGLFRKEVCLT